MKEKYKVLDLFSGLGGFSLGLERTGHFETVAFCDNDKFSKAILDKHWKGIKVYDDVREITKEKFKEDGIEFPDIITGGFPCQPFSVAGKQKGTGDDRHLWPEMFRIIKTFKPRFVIGENVRGIVNIQDGVVFETVCTNLEDEGYEVQPFNIPAAAVGAPHRRERIWFIAVREESMVNSDNIRFEQHNETEKTTSWRGTSATIESTSSTNVVNSEHIGSSTSEIGRSFNTSSNNDKERQNETSESKGTSGPRDGETMENPNNNGFERGFSDATKLLQGKNLRSTGARIQITLADEVMVEEIKANPELMELYKDYEMVTRKNLPEHREFVEYMREQTSVSELFEKTKIKKTTIEHWDETKRFSHPSVEDWNLIKPHLTTIKYDKEMTTLHSIEWKQETKIMWPTPTTKGFGHASEGQTMIMRRKVESGELTEKEAQAMLNGTTLRPPRLKEWMWPTPRASAAMSEDVANIAKRGTDRGRLEERIVKMMPTPTRRDYKDSGKAVINSTRDSLLGVRVAKENTEQWVKGGGALNPTWVEWLMGYPEEYTVLKDWAILSSRKSSKK